MWRILLHNRMYLVDTSLNRNNIYDFEHRGRYTSMHFTFESKSPDEYYKVSTKLAVKYSKLRGQRFGHL